MGILMALIAIWIGPNDYVVVNPDGSSDLYTDLGVCQFEDGNPNGDACVWTDPDTGRQFYVTSENYR